MLLQFHPPIQEERIETEYRLYKCKNLSHSFNLLLLIKHLVVLCVFVDDAHSSLVLKNSRLSRKECERAEKALSVARKAHEGQLRADGSEYIMHPIAATNLLLEWGADVETAIAGLLHDTLEDTPLTYKQIQDMFGEDIAALVEGVTKFSEADFAEHESLNESIETLRRLFEVMRRDIRVIVIKMADRLHNIRTLDAFSQERKVVFAKETLDVYYKIAYHLGMNDVCHEFVNICIPILYPEHAKLYVDFLKQTKAPMEEAVEKLKKEFKKIDTKGVLKEIRIVKNAQSFPQTRGEKDTLPADKGYYCVAIAKNIDSCYAAFKMLHSLYRPLRRKFHDYIAASPETGYRSLHTTVVGPNERRIQFRIRTEEMDEQEKKGILLHCFHTDGKPSEFSWLQRSEDLDVSTRQSSEEFWGALQSDIFQQSLQITLDGNTFSMPQGATVLDAVYAQYGKEGHTVSHITVNGIEKELGIEIADDDVLQIELGKEKQVNFEWLQYVCTKYSHNLIVDDLKERDRTEKLTLGQLLLQHELDRYKKTLVGELTKSQQERAAKQFGRRTFDEVVAMVGEGVISPRDVIFTVLPEQRRLSFLKRLKTAFRFHLKLSVVEQHRNDILPQVSALARVHDVNINNMSVGTSAQKDTLSVFINGQTTDRKHFADFLDALERHGWIHRIQTLLSLRQKFFLAFAFCFAFIVLLADVVLFPYVKEWLHLSPDWSVLFIQTIALIPILIVNYYFLQLLRHHVVPMRNDRWFVGLGFLLNIIGFFVIIGSSVIWHGFTASIFPLFAIFVASMFYFVFRFFQTEALFTNIDRQSRRPLSATQWKRLQKKKLAGYAFRLAAVAIWGMQPLYLRYTPANSINPFVRVFLTGIGVVLVTGLMIFLKNLVSRKKKIGQKPPKNVLLMNIIVGYILFTYFLNASLQHTTSTNFILFNNFSPVVALLIGALLWRTSLPYLKDPKHMMWIFLVFLMGSTGSGLIIYNSVIAPTTGTVYGDILGLTAMAADTLLVVSQIRYMKLYSQVSSLAINLRVFFSHIIITFPFLVLLFVFGHPIVSTITLIPLLFGVGAGILAGIGQILNYETFRRIDGFIAFLMFNVSILITFTVEVFFLDAFIPTWVYILGGLLIISSTVIAEIINSHCQRKGY